MTGSYPGQRTQAAEAPDWTHAACSGLDVNLFFPTPGANHHRIRLARAICSTCPIQKRCLEYALEFDPRDLPGIWAGTSTSERRTLRRTRVINNGTWEKTLR